MKSLILMAVLGILEALHCDKEFNYYDTYGNGFDITCQGITKDYLHLLQNITITNEISLIIQNSTLPNVTSNLFQRVRNIRYLHFENATLTFSKVTSVFEKLKKLEHLIIRNTKLLVNKFTFLGLTNLKQLVLKNNGIMNIEQGSFKDLRNLKYLEISRNNVVELKHLPLCELQKLKSLNLSGNTITNLNDVPCTQSFRSVGINLNNQNYVLNLDKPDYFNVTDISSKLYSIDLSYNNISKLGYSLTNWRNLKVLNLEGNTLSKIENNELSTLEGLEKVYLKYNMIESIGEKVFHSEYLQHLDISYNRLTYFSIKNVAMLEYLNLEHNLLGSVIINKVNKTSSLKTLILCNNKINDIQPYFLKNHAALELLNLASNNITFHNQSFSGLFQLNDLLISNNSIEEIPKLLFSNLTKLRKLDLSNNKIKYFVSNDTFRSLRNLEILNVSYNLLRELNYSIVEPLKNLNVLDIAGNRLNYVEYDLIINNLPLISVLNINDNYLSCEVLYKIIKYLRHKGISYTIKEYFDYEQENIAGIYCNSEKNMTNSLKTESLSGGSYALMIVGIVLGIVLAVIIIGLLLFKIHMFLKRRKYKADEFELIDE